jgi:hypothetical protein
MALRLLILSIHLGRIMKFAVAYELRLEGKYMKYKSVVGILGALAFSATQLSAFQVFNFTGYYLIEDPASLAPNPLHNWSMNVVGPLSASLQVAPATGGGLQIILADSVGLSQPQSYVDLLITVPARAAGDGQQVAFNWTFFTGTSGLDKAEFLFGPNTQLLAPTTTAQSLSVNVGFDETVIGWRIYSGADTEREVLTIGSFTAPVPEAASTFGLLLLGFGTLLGLRRKLVA